MSGMPDLAAKYKDEDLCFEYRQCADLSERQGQWSCVLRHADQVRSYSLFPADFWNRSAIAVCDGRSGTDFFQSLNDNDSGNHRLFADDNFFDVRYQRRCQIGTKRQAWKRQRVDLSRAAFGICRWFFECCFALSTGSAKVRTSACISHADRLELN